MSELDDLLEIIAVPPTRRGGRRRARRAARLRRRRRTQVGAVAVSVAAVAAAGFALHGSSGSPGAARVRRRRRCPARRHTAAPTSHAHQAHAARREDGGAAAARVVDRRPSGPTTTCSPSTSTRPADHLRLAQNEQGGGGIYGTKLDWNDGGMLEIVVSHSWGGAWHFYLLEDAGMPPTTYDGHAARVSTKRRRPGRLGGARGRDRGDPDRQHVVRQQRHVDARPSASPSTELLAAAADPRLRLPPYLR